MIHWIVSFAYGKPLLIRLFFQFQHRRCSRVLSRSATAGEGLWRVGCRGYLVYRRLEANLRAGRGRSACGGVGQAVLVPDQGMTNREWVASTGSTAMVP